MKTILEAKLAHEKQILGTEDHAAQFAAGARVSCAVCGRPARSTRERDARKCAYHLDVFKTPH
ncbi:MAG: hypothetical protein JO127_01155 [Caulobacteraceae bacterium]|nr:hypothetical protein [Caulobacteraceae bacterium]